MRKPAYRPDPDPFGSDRDPAAGICWLAIGLAVAYMVAQVLRAAFHIHMGAGG